MRANQRKTILMFIHGVDGNLPPGHSVAQIALRSISAAMNVGMAILAIAANIREDRMRMTLIACHRGVQAAQRIAGLVVIEFRFFADRLPR
ncbi:MAG: hypothetical protein WAN03_22340 [Candidatus Sulfotelmatobacter sp.]